MKKLMVILGAGESGVGAALLAKAKGYAVFVSDSGPMKPNFQQELADAGIEFEQGGHTMERILRATEVIESPGIPEKAEVVKAIRQRSIWHHQRDWSPSVSRKGKSLPSPARTGKRP